ncbi:hypothetical protein O181_030678 [Austropuccinia psidii MF-1]|uniref:Uncharacterized protein n=1 Tax=Austropuccinia psidii MF-1 TaxID=1389203 RepID=A0A9Q3CY57_9BASI|nr:hypothetical protein [Austropuccinia psidii MF-1]
MRLQHCPPISALTMPYASTPQPLSIFTLLQCPQDETTMMPSPLLTLPHPRLIFSLDYNPYSAVGTLSYAYNATLTTPYASLHTPKIPPMLLTILILAVPSQHASDAPYHPYACGVPSGHASDTAYHPYARSDFLTCLRRRLPSLRLYTSCPTCLGTLLTILMLAVPS